MAAVVVLNVYEARAAAIRCRAYKGDEYECAHTQDQEESSVKAALKALCASRDGEVMIGDSPTLEEDGMPGLDRLGSEAWRLLAFRDKQLVAQWPNKNTSTVASIKSNNFNANLTRS